MPKDETKGSTLLQIAREMKFKDSVHMIKFTKLKAIKNSSGQN